MTRLISWYDFLQSNFFPRAAITIGVFDGVHLGHQKLLQAIIDHANTYKSTPLVFTFCSDLKKTTRGLSHTQVQTIEDRLDIFAELGIYHVVLIDFTEKFSNLSGESFWNTVLSKVPIQYLALGDDFRMGHNGKLDITGIQNYFFQYEKNQDALCHTEIEVIPAVMIGGKRVSSSRLRDAVRQGNVEEYARLTGRAYTLKLSQNQTLRPGEKIQFPPGGTYLATALDANGKMCRKTDIVQITPEGIVKTAIANADRIQLHRMMSIDIQ